MTSSIACRLGIWGESLRVGPDGETQQDRDGRGLRPGPISRSSSSTAVCDPLLFR